MLPFGNINCFLRPFLTTDRNISGLLSKVYRRRCQNNFLHVPSNVFMDMISFCNKNCSLSSFSDIGRESFGHLSYVFPARLSKLNSTCEEDQVEEKFIFFEEFLHFNQFHTLSENFLPFSQKKIVGFVETASS